MELHVPTDGKNVMYYLHGGWIKLPQKRCKNWVLIKENASLSEKLAAFLENSRDSNSKRFLVEKQKM